MPDDYMDVDKRNSLRRLLNLELWAPNNKRAQDGPDRRAPVFLSFKLVQLFSSSVTMRYDKALLRIKYSESTRVPLRRIFGGGEYSSTA